MAHLSAPPPIRRLDPQDPTAAREAGPATIAPPANGNGAVHSGGFTGAKRSIAASHFSIRRMEVDQVSVHYGPKEAVKSVSLPIRQGEVLSLIGPSGCGKTTLLRSLNRLTELTAAARSTGSIRLDDVDIQLIEPTLLRRRVAMVFQQPNPFPMSVFDNIAYVLREQGSRRRGDGSRAAAVGLFALLPIAVALGVVVGRRGSGDSNEGALLRALHRSEQQQVASASVEEEVTPAETTQTGAKGKVKAGK